MGEEYRIEYVDNPEESAWGTIGRGVGSYNKQQAGGNDFQRLCYVLRCSEAIQIGSLSRLLRLSGRKKWLYDISTRFFRITPGSADQEIVGGLLGETYWEWFYVDLIWVKVELRGQGYGKQLMEISEAEARRRGAKNAYLDTFSFQAPGFYEGLGYEIFGELDDYPPGHRRYFMKKKL